MDSSGSCLRWSKQAKNILNRLVTRAYWILEQCILVPTPDQNLKNIRAREVQRCFIRQTIICADLGISFNHQKIEQKGGGHLVDSVSENIIGTESRIDQILHTFQRNRELALEPFWYSWATYTDFHRRLTRQRDPCDRLSEFMNCIE